MSFTHAYFRREQHCPLPFLGQKTSLPELTGYRDDIREALENPILDPSQLLQACNAIEIVSSGYDLKISEEKWGVMSARVLEALFWKVLSLETMEFKNAQGEKDFASKFQVYGAGCLFHDIARDLTVSAFFGPDRAVKIEYPSKPSSRSYVMPQDDGNDRASAFWAPLSPISIIMALAAWEALRFTTQKNEKGQPRRFEVDLERVRENGPLSVMGDLFGPQFAAHMQSWRLNQSTPPPGRAGHALRSGKRL